MLHPSARNCISIDLALILSSHKELRSFLYDWFLIGEIRGHEALAKVGQ